TEFERTPPGILMGTPEYMAPEQVMHPSQADYRADIYALGVVLYEMLAGRCPFEGDDLRHVLYQVANEPPPPLGRAVPPALEPLRSGGLLVKSRDHRIQTMAEVTMVLGALLSAMIADAPRSLDDLAAEATALCDPIWEVEISIDDAGSALEP